MKTQPAHAWSVPAGKLPNTVRASVRMHWKNDLRTIKVHILTGARVIASSAPKQGFVPWA
ncbi:MAG: hypothetical protein LBP52_07345 [Burkholderiaceae bacterium]|nr:hypothetical protein [Burkholderiaceae bacterium]